MDANNLQNSFELFTKKRSLFTELQKQTKPIIMSRVQLKRCYPKNLERREGGYCRTQCKRCRKFQSYELIEIV